MVHSQVASRCSHHHSRMHVWNPYFIGKEVNIGVFEQFFHGARDLDNINLEGVIFVMVGCRKQNE